MLSLGHVVSSFSDGVPGPGSFFKQGAVFKYDLYMKQVIRSCTLSHRLTGFGDSCHLINVTCLPLPVLSRSSLKIDEHCHTEGSVVTYVAAEMAQIAGTRLTAC